MFVLQALVALAFDTVAGIDSGLGKHLGLYKQSSMDKYAGSEP